MGALVGLALVLRRPACPGSIATVVGVGTLTDLCSGCCRYTATPLAQQVLQDKEYEAKVGSAWSAAIEQCCGSGASRCAAPGMWITAAGQMMCCLEAMLSPRHLPNPLTNRCWSARRWAVWRSRWRWLGWCRS